MRYPFLRVKGDSCLCSRRWRKLRVEMEKENSEWRWRKKTQSEDGENSKALGGTQGLHR
jgi:hypothetical protein